MKTFPDFENEVKAIDPRLSVVENPRMPGLANILLDGHNICAIPNGVILDHTDPSYKYILPNGWEVPHKSREEALGRVHSVIKSLENPDEADAFFGRGDYAG